MYLTIETNNCDITSKRPCATKLINSGFLQETCSPLIDGITYKCLISTDYIYLVCCILHKEGIRETISNSCTPSKPLLLRIIQLIFSSNLYSRHYRTDRYMYMYVKKKKKNLFITLIFVQTFQLLQPQLCPISTVQQVYK